MATPSSTEHPAADPPRRRRRRRRRTSHLERRLVRAVAVAAAVGAAFADGRPSGAAVADVVLRAGFAATIVLAGSRARRLPLLAMAGVAAVAAEGAASVAPGAGALVVALFAIVTERRGRLIGAVVAGLAVQALLRLPAGEIHGTSAFLAGVACLPVLVSGFRNAPRADRKKVRAAVLGAGVVTGVLVGLFLVSLADARAGVERGISDARKGLTAIRRGEQDEGIARFDDAARAFTGAHNDLSSWWSLPSRALPIVGYQLRAMATVTDEGASLANVAAKAAIDADVRELEFVQGRVDLELIASFETPLRSVVDALRHATGRIHDVSSPWLVAPLQDRIDALAGDIDTALPQAENAIAAVSVAPSLLGADGPRRYFVAFITPAELRGLGGFMGNFGELVADGGKITLTRSGRTDDLRPRNREADLVISGPPDYLQRYGAARPGHFVQDIPFSPDFPTVAKVYGEIYPQVEGGEPVDGVIALDPFALAALLKYTGPINVEGWDEPLTERNAAAVLTREQYTAFGDSPDRLDFLDEATRLTFEKLTNSDLPDPRVIANQLGPLVEQGRLMAYSTHQDEQALFERINLDNTFPPVADGDFFAVTSQNAGNSKIDVFLERELRYDATWDPSTGGVDAVATITLHNGAPASGLPAYVIGNHAGRPPGTNLMNLTVYSPLLAGSARIDGTNAPFNALEELGRWAYGMVVEVPPGGTVEVQLELSGAIAPATTYQLTVANQPMILDDQLEVTVTPAGGGRFELGDGVEIAGGQARVTMPFVADAVLRATLR